MKGILTCCSRISHECIGSSSRTFLQTSAVNRSKSPATLPYPSTVSQELFGDNGHDWECLGSIKTYDQYVSFCGTLFRAHECPKDLYISIRSSCDGEPDSRCHRRRRQLRHFPYPRCRVLPKRRC